MIDTFGVRMRQTLLTILSVFLLTTAVYTQKKSTLFGDAWIGVVESADEATREIKLVNPDKKAETFVGYLVNPYVMKLKDGTSREIPFSEIKPGMRIRAFYKSKTEEMNATKRKFNLITRVQIMGHDSYTLLREMLKLDPSLPVTVAEPRRLPAKDPLKLYLALQPPNLDKGFVKWMDLWNKEQSAKHGRVEIVNDLAQSDASLVVIWGDDDSYVVLPYEAGSQGRPIETVIFITAYLVSKDDNGLHVMWQLRGAISVKNPEVDGLLLGKHIEKQIKARSK